MGEKTSKLVEYLSEDGRVIPKKIHSIDLRKSIEVACLLLFSAMVYLGPLMSLKYDRVGDSDSGSGNAARQIIYIIISCIMLYQFLRSRQIKEILFIPITIYLLFLWSLMSVFWAIDPSISARRLFLTLDIFYIIIIFSKIINYDQINQNIRISLSVLLVANYIFVIFFPEIGIHENSQIEAISYGHNWRGLMAHKNFAGATCALLIIYMIFDNKNYNRLLAYFTIIFSTFFLYESQSKTSAGVVLIAIAAGYSFKALSGRLRVFMVIGLALLSACSAIVAISYTHNITGDLLHPRSFTGRGQIWAAMLNYCQDNYIFGAGFGSFWNIGFNSPIYHYTTGFATTVTVGHNGYLDLAATIGIPGLLMAVMSMLILPFSRVILDSRIDRDQGSLFVAILVFTIGHNVTESSVFDRDSIVGVFLLFSVAQIYKVSRGRYISGKRDIGDELVRSVNKSQRISNRKQRAH